MAATGNTSVGTVSVDIEGNVKPFQQSIEDAKNIAKSGAKDISQSFTNEVSQGAKSSAASITPLKDSFKDLFNESARLQSRADNLIHTIKYGFSKDVTASAKEAAGGIAGIGDSFKKTEMVSLSSIASIGMGVGGLMMAVYGVNRALDFLFQAMEKGAALQRQAEAFSNLSAESKKSSEDILANLRKVSRGFVSESELIKASGTAMMMGIPIDKLTDLMRIAEATSRQTGQTVTKAFDDIALGVARQSKRILDNLGIIVSVRDANEQYAKALGRTADSLDDTERRQAFLNATIEAGNKLVERLGDPSGSVDNVNKALVSQKNMWDEISKTIGIIVNEQMPEYIKTVDWITNKLREYQESRKQTSREDLISDIERLQKLIQQAESGPPGVSGFLGKAKTELNELEQKYKNLFVTPLMNLPTPGRENIGIYGRSVPPTPTADYEKFRQQEMAFGVEEWGTPTADELKELVKQRTEAMKDWEDDVRLLNKAQSKLRADTVKEQLDDEKELQKAQDKLRADTVKKQEEEKRRAIEVEKEFVVEYEKTIYTAYDGEMAKIDVLYQKYLKYIGDKAKVDEWYNRRKDVIELKQYAELAPTREMGIEGVNRGGEPILIRPEFVGDWDAEAQRAKTYKENIKNAQKIGEEFEKANEELWKKSVTYGEDTFNQFENMSQRTADAMEQNFSDFFFDQMTGEFKSLADYALALFRVIERGLADLMGQIAKEGLFGGGKMVEGGGLLTSLFNTMFGSNWSIGTNTEFAGGQTIGDFLGMVKAGDQSVPISEGWASYWEHHKGGEVGDNKNPIKLLPSWMIVDAPRFHTGLNSDEFPAVLQKGERVIPKGASNVNNELQVIVNNYGREQVSVKEQAPAGPNDIRRLYVSIGADVASGGPSGRSIENVYGLRRQGVRRG